VRAAMKDGRETWRPCCTGMDATTALHNTGILQRLYLAISRFLTFLTVHHATDLIIQDSGAGAHCLRWRSFLLLLQNTRQAAVGGYAFLL